jgi:hypothetical protein
MVEIDELCRGCLRISTCSVLLVCTQLRGMSTYLTDKIIKAKGHPFYPNRLVRSTRLSIRRSISRRGEIVLKMTNVAFACHNEGSDTRNANIATP